MTARHERIRGRRGVRIRRMARALQPLCVKCLERGIVRPSEEIDHMVPLSEGGTNDMSNMQALCTDCHLAKTTGKQRQRIGDDGWPVEG